MQLTLHIQITKYGDKDYVASVLDPEDPCEMPWVEAQGTTARAALTRVIDLIAVEPDMKEESSVDASPVM